MLVSKLLPVAKNLLPLYFEFTATGNGLVTNILKTVFFKGEIPF